MSDTSTPTLTEFDPTIIPFQYRVIYDIRKGFDYDRGVHEILASGSVGSSKSLLGAHLACTHAILNKNARVLLGRRTLPSLKDTLIRKCLEHLSTDLTYWINRNRGTIWFSNGSVLVPYSWADGNYKKVRSEEFSAAVIEELTENDEQEFYDEIKMRVGRLKHVKEKFILCLSNPDSPEHWAYKYFIQSKHPNRHVYYSKTSDNPFLPESYIKSLEETLDPKLVRRMIHGEWIEINSENIYYSYSKDHNFTKLPYKINETTPIRLSFDFNIGVGKPMSSVAAQRTIDGRFHFFAETVVEGARTENIMEEWASKGVLDFNTSYIINADATGKRRDTRSNRSDLEIISQFLDRYRRPDGNPIRYRMDVPLHNPRIRDRHNIVNGQLHSSTGTRRVMLYGAFYDKSGDLQKGIEVLDEGFRLTKLKTGAKYDEDDTKYYQHSTTAAGYLICSALVGDRPRQITNIA